MIGSPLKVGDTAICDLRLYRVVEVDRYGFCTLRDMEAETIIRHQSYLADCFCAPGTDVFRAFQNSPFRCSTPHLDFKARSPESPLVRMRDQRE